MALKKHYSDIRFSGNLVSPDEIDRYEVYTIVNPSAAANWIGTAASTASGAAAPTFGFLSKIADYPRSLRAVSTTGSGTAVGGTFTVVGKDQFGNVGTEVITTLGTAAATAHGTKVFSHVTSVSIAQATITGDVGTHTLGGGTLGTSALFGLPVKIGSTADVAMYRYQSNGTSLPVNKGTIGAFIDTATHSVKAVADVTGTTALQVWFKSSYNSENDATGNAGLTLLT